MIRVYDGEQLRDAEYARDRPMTATSPTRFAPEYMTSTVIALLAQIEANPVNARHLMPILADALQDAGCDNADVSDLRAGLWQLTRPGERIVAVGRDGADHYGHGGIYTTKVYEAQRRAKDGRLTWRLAYSLSGHRTAGKSVTGPMIARAEAYAEEMGLPTATHITHGTVCL